MTAAVTALSARGNRARSALVVFVGTHGAKRVEFYAVH
jgi:hypothetical protein